MPEKVRKQRGSRVGAAHRPVWRGVGLRVVMMGAGALAVVGFGLVAALGNLGGSGGGTTERLPSYAYNSAATLAAYKAAARISDVLASIPCYCGCGVSQGHVSLRDCFIASSGAYSDHASNCHICVEEAVDVRDWHDEGVGVREIRSRIERNYSGYGPGTTTPPIA